LPTLRDRIWSTTLQLVEFQRTFTASDVLDAIDGEPPTERTVRNTLNAMETLDLLESEDGTGSAPRRYYPQDPSVPEVNSGYTPRESSQTGTFPYPGGKGDIAQWIVATMPAHDTYVEVFGGAAGVMYTKPRSKYEIYNDHNEDLPQFFTVLRDRPDELSEWLQSVPYSRSQYEDWVAEFYNGVRPDDPIARAGRFFSLRYMQFLGIASSPNGFKTRARRSPARTFENARKRIHSLARRFNQVTIESQDYQAILEKYDDAAVDVLFYADPPYVGGEDQYEGEFDHEAFVDCLRDIENDWMVSCSTIPEGLSECTIVEQQSRHRMTRSSDGVPERIVCNFDPEERHSFAASTIAD
jgi:DNA adenine methylase